MGYEHVFRSYESTRDVAEVLCTKVNSPAIPILYVCTYKYAVLEKLYIIIAFLLIS